MKKIISLIVVVFILISTLCACNMVNDDNTNETETGKVTLSSSSFSSKTFNLKVAGNKTDYKLINSYYDDENYYYCIKIGMVEDVIVDDNPNVKEFRGGGGATFSDTYTKSKVTSTSVEQQSTWTSERLEYDNHLAGVSWGVKVGVFEMFDAEISGSVQYYQNQTTTTNSGGQTIKKEEVLSEQETITMVLDSTCNPGYYRIVHAMDYDIFVIAEKNIETGKICYEILTMPKKGITQIYEYSETEFEDPTLDGLTFDTTYIDTLAKPNQVIETIVPAGNTTEYAGGFGTAEEPYLIKTATHLRNINLNLDKHYKLINDIDLLSVDWSPIGFKNGVYSLFSGVFDGNYHVIKNLARDTKPAYDSNSLAFQGLFGDVQDAEIKNLKIENINYSYSSSNYTDSSWLIVGTIAGRCTNTTISNCSSSGNIVDSGNRDNDHAEYIGGIIGEANGNTIINHCSSIVNLKGYHSIIYIGGIVGNITGSNNFVSNSYYIGTIYAEGEWSSGRLTCAGGIVGHVNNNNYVNVTNCYAISEISVNHGWYRDAGGIIGTATSSKHNDSVSNNIYYLKSNLEVREIWNINKSGNFKEKEYFKTGAEIQQLPKYSIETFEISDGKNCWIYEEGQFPKLYWEII